MKDQTVTPDQQKERNAYLATWAMMAEKQAVNRRRNYKAVPAHINDMCFNDVDFYSPEGLGKLKVFMGESENNMEHLWTWALENDALYEADVIREMMISAGVDLNELNVSHAIAVVEFATSAKWDWVSALSPVMNIDVRNEKGQTALMIASAKAPLEVVEKILASGAKLDLVDVEGFGALECAAIALRKDVFNLLVSHGAKPSKKRGGAQKAMAVVAMRGGLAMMGSLDRLGVGYSGVCSKEFLAGHMPWMDFKRDGVAVKSSVQGRSCK